MHFNKFKIVGQQNLIEISQFDRDDSKLYQLFLENEWKIALRQAVVVGLIEKAQRLQRHGIAIVTRYVVARR